jgi:mono/diheme cytochrome c family protein
MMKPSLNAHRLVEGRPGLRRLAALSGLLSVATVAISACSTVAPAPATGSVVNLAAERGHRIAQIRCAGCHAIESTGASPSIMAPPFRNLRLRYNPISMERHLAELTRTGYADMAPQPIGDDEALAIAAYIEALRPQ